MTEVEVGFGAVLGDEHLAVLVGAHRAGVDVEIGVELLHGDPVAALFEEHGQPRSGDSLAEAGDHSAGYENVLGHDLQRSIRLRN